MRKDELIKYFGEIIFEDFDKWMVGKTVEILPNKEVDYYSQDINKYRSQLIRIIKENK